MVHMQRMTLGFIFDEAMEHVVLIEKQTPAWQRGRYNGIGGKYEGEESARACIVREVLEECGLETAEEAWTEVGSITGSTWHVDILTYVHRGDPRAVRSMEDERVDWYRIDALPERVHSNIPWLIALAKDKLTGRPFTSFSAVYND